MIARWFQFSGGTRDASAPVDYQTRAGEGKVEVCGPTRADSSLCHDMQAESICQCQILVIEATQYLGGSGQIFGIHGEHARLSPHQGARTKQRQACCFRLVGSLCSVAHHPGWARVRDRPLLVVLLWSPHHANLGSC
jgi:hypothetical protein